MDSSTSQSDCWSVGLICDFLMFCFPLVVELFVSHGRPDSGLDINHVTSDSSINYCTYKEYGTGTEVHPVIPLPL